MPKSCHFTARRLFLCVFFIDTGFITLKLNFQFLRELREVPASLSCAVNVTSAANREWNSIIQTAQSPFVTFSASFHEHPSTNTLTKGRNFQGIHLKCVSKGPVCFAKSATGCILVMPPLDLELVLFCKIEKSINVCAIND